ncbi:MAG: PHB depolymerase family esterase [Pseudomonadota bacterium]
MVRPFMRTAIFTTAVLMQSSSAYADQICGEPNVPCKTDFGEYHIKLPDKREDGIKPPIVVFLHGYGGSGKTALKNKGFIRAITDRGYAFVAPTGLQRPGGRRGSWSFHPNFPKQRDEHAFIRGVADDAARRFGLDASQVLLTGFSVGGSMVSYLACQHPNAFTAYAPLAGGFWRPHPAGCNGPVRLLHTHGWRDTTVPLEGRRLRGGAIKQGDVFHTLNIWRQANGCIEMRADKFVTKGPFWRRKWERCTPGSALEFALHTGGHGFPRGWSTMILDWFEGLTTKRS